MQRRKEGERERDTHTLRSHFYEHTLLKVHVRILLFGIFTYYILAPYTLHIIIYKVYESTMAWFVATVFLRRLLSIEYCPVYIQTAKFFLFFLFGVNNCC